MIDKRYLVSVDLSSQNQGVTVSSASVSETQIAATTFLTGPKGADGTAGAGVAVGGTINQYLKKNSSTNYDTSWDSLDKNDVGLSNVDNTSDLSKPISTLTQTALNAKQATLVSGTNIKTVNGTTLLGSGDLVITGGSGTVTSVNATGANGVSVSGGPITTSGSLTIGLGAITPTSVASTGAVTGTNLSGTNTGDQTTVTGNAGTATTLQTARTIGTLTGDVTTAGSTFNGSANNTNATVLATVNSNVGTFGSATQVPVYTVNAKGLTTASANTSIQIAESQVTNLVTDLAGKLSNITGLITAGSNVTITGTGTSGSPYNISSTAAGGGGGTVTNVSSTSGDATIANPTTTPAITIVSAPKLTTARTINGVSFDGTANINVPTGISRSIAILTTASTLGATASTDYVVFVGSGGAPTLPTAVGNTNAYEINNDSGAAITVSTTGGQTINGSTSISLLADESRKFYSNNTNWKVF